jgi:hypothetical protein
MRWSQVLVVAMALGCADASVDDGVTAFGEDSGLPPVTGGGPTPQDPNPGPDDPNPGPDDPDPGPDDPDPGPDDPDPGPDDPNPGPDDPDPGPEEPGCPRGGVVGLACAPDGSPIAGARVAVTTGEFDSIETIVSRLGFERDVYCGDAFGNYGARGLLGDWDVLSTYDVVMINCGLTIDFGSPASQVMAHNLRRFVQGGGSLYISDLAASVIEAAWPDKIQFDSERLPGFPLGECCDCVDCPAHCGANLEAPRLGGQCMGTLAGGGDLFCIGEPTFIGREDPGHVRATVRNEALQRSLGRDNLDIEFESGGWVSIIRTSPDVEVLVEANGMPLLVQFEDPSSGGRVAFTTFHNEAQVAADVEQILRALVFQL